MAKPISETPLIPADQFDKIVENTKAILARITPADRVNAERKHNLIKRSFTHN